MLYAPSPMRVEREARQITAVAVQHLVTEAITHVTAKVFLDATELGDLMPLAQVPFHMGMEAGNKPVNQVPAGRKQGSHPKLYLYLCRRVLSRREPCNRQARPV